MAEINKKTLRLTTLAVLGALAIVLSALENLIPPLPMMPPGAKLGLSNIVTMFAAGHLWLDSLFGDRPCSRPFSRALPGAVHRPC